LAALKDTLAILCLNEACPQHNTRMIESVGGGLDGAEDVKRSGGHDDAHLAIF